MRHGESFHPSLLAFLFAWWTKMQEIAEEVFINCMAFTYYITLMVKCTCAWFHHPLKLLPSILLLCTNSSQPGSFNAEAYMHVRGLCICQYSWCYQANTNDRLIDWKIFMSRTTKYVMFYAWTNRRTHLFNCNVPIQLLFVLSAWQQAYLNINCLNHY